MSQTDPGASWPSYREDDFVIKDYHFASGEVLPELRLHYRTMGMPRPGGSSTACCCCLSRGSAAA